MMNKDFCLIEIWWDFLRGKKREKNLPNEWSSRAKIGSTGNYFMYLYYIIIILLNTFFNLTKAVMKRVLLMLNSKNRGKCVMSNVSVVLSIFESLSLFHERDLNNVDNCYF